MPNFPFYAGQQAVTTVPTPLPVTVPKNPLDTVLSGGSIRGEGWRVNLTCLKAGTQSLFYGNNASVSVANGKEIAPGNQDVLVVNDISQIFVIAAGNGTSVASWSLSPAG